MNCGGIRGIRSSWLKERVRIIRILLEIHTTSCSNGSALRVEAGGPLPAVILASGSLPFAALCARRLAAGAPPLAAVCPRRLAAGALPLAALWREVDGFFAGGLPFAARLALR